MDGLQMHLLARPTSRHVVTRLICAFLAVGGVVAVVLEVVTVLHASPLPTPVAVISGVAALCGVCWFGFYAIKGAGHIDTGVLSEASENVRTLALRPDSKPEAIQAYREQTGVDVRRAIQVVEQLSSSR